MSSRFRHYFIIISILIFSIVFSLVKGSTPIPLYQLLLNDYESFNFIFFKLRLPRTVAAFTSGGLLALAGACMQLLLQNPLADPYVLGISGGAAFATVLMMFFGVSEYYLIGGAWMGSLLTVLFILLLAKKHGFRPHTLLLTGIALACGFSACISFILIISEDTNLHNMLFWLIGDLNNTQMPWLALLILFVATIILIFLAPGLNILTRGEKPAKTLGLPSEKYRFALFLLSSICTATAVTLTGCIGFIGLIVPHLARRFVGFDQRILLPFSILLGGSLLTIADTFARIAFAPQQIPVGIFLAVIGVPLFVWQLL